METEPVFLHIRVVMGIILGLSITTLLKGLAQIIEHPQRRGCSALHLCWVMWTLVSLVTFWWWEFRLVAPMPSMEEASLGSFSATASPHDENLDRSI